MADKKYPKLMLVTPTLDGKVSADYTFSMTNLKTLLYKNSINFTLKMHIGDSILPGARNYLAHSFLQSDADWLLMVDSDISYKAEDIIEALPHLDGAIIGLPCAKKFTQWDRLVKTLRDNPDFPAEMTPAIMANANFSLGVSDYLFPNKFGLAKVDWIGTGVMLVSRSTLEKIMQDNPDQKTMVNEEIIHEFFEYTWEWAESESGRRYRRYSGEDVSFCELARKSGITVYAKVDAVTTHTGFMNYKFDATAVAKLKNVPSQLESKKGK